ncbi:hypothetical protein BS78_01G325900 [Paspalum vaginatum]|nr:hypothetical protein BS78_01G325900 [Paspalum vaginatum]
MTYLFPCILFFNGSVCMITVYMLNLPWHQVLSVSTYSHHLLNALYSFILFFFCITDCQNVEDIDGYDGFHAALRCSYYRFVKGLSLQCKQEVRVHLASVMSCYSHICYGNEFSIGVGTVVDSMNRFNRLGEFSSFDLSDSGSVLEEAQGNMPPKGQQHMTPPAKGNELDDVLRENQPITPVGSSLDVLSDVDGGKHKNKVIPDDHGPRKKLARINNNTGVKSGPSYSTIYTTSAECFANMRNVLIESYVPSVFISGFLEPCL